MTIRHHLQTLQLPPVILLSFSVNYTNHFLQDGSSGCQPGIYHSCICICWIHEQVNQVSHELIQVAWIQTTSWLFAKSTWCPPLPHTPNSIFSSFTPHPVCLPLWCVFQCSSWAITQLQTCKYQQWGLMRTSHYLYVDWEMGYMLLGLLRVLFTLYYTCSVILPTVYLVQYIFQWAWVALWRSSVTCKHLCPCLDTIIVYCNKLESSQWKHCWHVGIYIMLMSVQALHIVSLRCIFIWRQYSLRIMSDRKEIVYPLFYLPLHHSMHTVGISAMFHSLQATSSLGVGKHEQFLVCSTNTIRDGEFNCI